MPDSCWVVTKLTDFSRHADHVDLDVLESEGKEIAKARVTMFANVAGNVIAERERVTGGLPQAGMRVPLKARAEFSPQYRFHSTPPASTRATRWATCRPNCRRLFSFLAVLAQFFPSGSQARPRPAADRADVKGWFEQSSQRLLAGQWLSLQKAAGDVSRCGARCAHGRTP